MDANAPRPRSRGQGLRSAQEQGNVVRKVFNCIVDDSALIQGAKKSTRDGIPKWVAAGAIRLFVPLFALDQTSRAKEGKGRVANDAAEALQWLDDATSKHPDFVTLQGGFEQFETWAEVEKFAQPKPLFSEEDYMGEEDLTDIATKTEKSRLENSSEDIGQSFSSNESFISESTAPSHRSLRSASPLSPPTSPPKKRIEPAAPEISDSTSAPGSDSSETPASVRPLINYILWRVHEESNPAEALDSFVFLSDNQAMRKYAHRFGIRSKTLSEIRYVIARESQDARNRQAVQQKEASAIAGNQGHARDRSGDLSKSNGRPVSRQNAQAIGKPEIKVGSVSDEDEILLKRAPKGPAALTKSPPQTRRNVESEQPPRTPRAGLTGPALGTPRNAARVASRGRGAMTPRGRGKAVPAQPSGPIDPDSFARPSPSRGGARGGRGLWMPT
ncbi:hypothetical protein B9Z65_342 [Elsinoe australis]|uniref:PIN domain-containing protein n=1 Tax=Elsinoe australis TaxID=40998 RepID=A0A2P7ZQA2_9PEZI|nr:hypothetical protein B9Z65_342 [Elsinoe australis]